MLPSGKLKQEEIEIIEVENLENTSESEQTDGRPFKCKLCPKAYRQGVHLKDHLYSHEDEKKFKCDQCEKSFTYSKTYRRHMQTHKNLQRFECHLCKKSYASQKSLREHEESHKNDPSLTCDVCGKEFWSAARYKQHKERNHEKRFTCEFCSMGFSRKASLKRHQERIHAKRLVYECEECDFRTVVLKLFDLHKSKHSMGAALEKLCCEHCDFVTYDLRNLRRHRRRHDDSMLWYQCSLCDFKCRKDRTLRAHIFKVHGGIKDFKCGECELSFMTKLLLDAHMKKHVVTNHRCGQCFKYFTRKYALHRHFGICTGGKAEIDEIPVDPDPLATDNGLEFFEEIPEVDNLLVVKDERDACQQSARMFSSSQVKKEELEVDDVKIIHLESVIESEAEQLAKKSKDDRPYKCNLCPKTYKQSINLRSHMYSHENEKKFKCNVCAKSYIYSHDYKRHMQTHEGFNCDLCHEIFNQREELREHKETHEKLRCGQCKTSFSSRSALRRHMHKIHMRFKCQLCLQSYSSEISLRKHEESHKDNPPVTCELCGEQFWSAVRCKNHKETHHEKRFSCETCSKQFPRKASLKRHIEVMHMGVVVFKCEECDFSTKNSKKFDVHTWKHSQGIVLVKMFCDLCDYVTFCKKNLTVHKRRLHDKSLPWYQCSLCDSKFRKDSVLRRHVFKLHGGIKDFKCVECGLTFMTKLLLDVHVKKHTVTKHRCGRCFKYYKNGDSLKKHEQSCTVEKAESVVDVPVDPDPLAIDKEDELFGEIEELDNSLVVMDERDNG